MRTRPRYLATLSSLLLGVGALLCCLLSCDESFNPSAPFQPRMVVYCVLTTESDTQYVRVYSTYNPPDNDRSTNLDEIPVTDANVTISSDSALYQFQKTVVQRVDKSRYASDIVAYISYPFKLARGKTYKLTVTSPTVGTATATATVPSVASISPSNFFAVADPYKNAYVERYGVNVYLSAQAKAFLVRIYVDYLASTPQGWQLRRRQIPVLMKPISLYEGTWTYIYPVVKRRQWSSARYQESELFTIDAWIKMLENDIWLYDGPSVRFLQAVIHVIQFDEPLYNYYGVANISRDRYSVRIDEPDYTNMHGGVGVFGSFAVDSTAYELPETISRPGPK